MAKPKGSKYRKTNKKVDGFRFNKTRQVREFEGRIPKHDVPRSPIKHTLEEEVFIVDTLKTKKTTKPATFNQISNSLSITALVEDDNNDVVVEDTEGLGFFFDSTPAEPTVAVLEEPVIALDEDVVVSRNYREKKSKIIQDDSVFIESDDDDGISISSSEDVSMLDALAHWGSSTTNMFHEEVAGHRYHSDDEEDYAMLRAATLDDIMYGSDEMSNSDSSEEEEEEEDDLLLMDSHLDLDELQVPESLKKNYRGLLQQENSRIKKGVKQQQKRKGVQQRNPVVERSSKSRKSNLFDQVLNDFIHKDHLSSYRLTNLTFRGRHVVVPKIARLFQLDISEISSSKRDIELVKTTKTSVPKFYKQLAKKQATKTKRIVKTTPRSSRFNEQLHGKEVASSSQPISADNKGHRMLAAMGWKQGDAIGNNANGIKEPVKVYMRANQRGLGA